jgi:glycosyltransferase involved in cell wall biosynthesis
MTTKPLLILSDSPSSTTGLGRICRDLATRLHKHCSDIFRVATLGYGGPGSSKLPFQQYGIHSIDNWLVPELPMVWEDFAGSERGIVLTIWDPSRLQWFSQPDYCKVPGLSEWLKVAPFDRWGYFPVDASGPNGKLTEIIKHSICGYDRGLCYSKWAEGIVRETIGETHAGRLGLTSLPHGIDTAIFQPHDRQEAKQRFRKLGFIGLTDSSFLVGIVATNQARKDFGLGIEVCSRLLKQGLDVRIWIHTDVLKRHWDIVALLQDFDLLGRVVITTNPFTDEQMCQLYSACDVTLGIGLGEGFGYPIFESLASGTPCIHGWYGGAAEHLPETCMPSEGEHRYRMEGQFNCVRPVWTEGAWTHQIHIVKDLTIEHEKWMLPEHLDWNNLWPRWEAWFREGVKK